MKRQNAFHNSSLRDRNDRGQLETFLHWLLLVLAALASGSSLTAAQIAVVSGADFQPTVAPGSFATGFGTGLAPSIVSGTPDADGRYPQQLGGLTVTVGGTQADLLMVSPGQINFVVPFSAQYGTINVVVAHGLTTVATGSMTIAPTAPAVFTATGDGKGLGAILNAFDFTPPPFAVNTKGKTTIIAVYGTGFRFAGSTPVTVSSGDVSSHVTAIALDTTGKKWTLPVLYAGPVPGYEGLDQINVELDPSMNPSSDLTLRLATDAVQANPVYVLLRPETPPTVSAVMPISSSPGSFVTVTGSGLMDASRFQSSSREFGVFVLADGTQVPAPLLSMAVDSAELLVPAAPVDAQKNYYHGPAQICLVVDTQRSCLPDLFTIANPIPTGEPIGTALMSFAQETVQQALAAITMTSRLASPITGDSWVSVSVAAI